jgi:hypothetical protein
MDQQAAHRLRVLQQQFTLVRPRASESAAPFNQLVPDVSACFSAGARGCGRAEPAGASYTLRGCF